MERKGRIAAVGVTALIASNSFGSMILTALARPQVGLVAQCNLVTWNPATKMESLVQASAFLSQAKRFEVLIPTPTIPTVKEVGDSSIDFASNLITPPRASRPITPPNPDDELDPSFGVLIRGKAEVKQVTFVGNLKATTIKGSDVVALSDWMAKNGYKASAAQNQWLEKYVAKRWYFTSIQINSDSDTLRTRGVRLSFKTEVPVVPYTSPKNSWVQNLRQEVFFVSPAHLQGTIGGKSLWTGRLMGHAFLTKKATPEFAKDLGLFASDVADQSWVSRYVDVSAPETATDDLYFLKIPRRTK